MPHQVNSRFWSLYDALPADTRARADKQFVLLKTNPHDPSLRFKKIGERGGEEIWSAQVTLNYRALAIKWPDEFLCFGLASMAFMTS